ncbi:MAG: hypothetical protein IIC74_05780, partial [Bacteroidetes bacterium]|nr:hypothetical protein [Bacteroidota bacterium]
MGIGKKGELTSKQLITIIILIIGFSIILIFFFSLNLKSNIDAESLRNSVVLRGAISVFGKSPVSISCKTQNVCLSMGGDCQIDGGDVENIRVNDKNELIKEMVELTRSCWWMMGEGEINYG